MASASPFATRTFILSPPRLSKPSVSSPPLLPPAPLRRPTAPISARRLFGRSVEPPDASPDDPEGATFGRAVQLFNTGDYYRCHDSLEDMWFGAEEPVRTLLHGILQCAVGLHHLFNQNHRGAMLELGEGLCKLRKMAFEDGPFLEFEKEVSEVLEFLYQTQKELAACTEELCLPMDGSEASYRLLGSFAAGQQVYSVDVDEHGVGHLVFTNVYNSSGKPMVKVPKLEATEEDLRRCRYV